MNPYRILKTDNGYEIVRVSYDEDGKPKSMGSVDFISAGNIDGIDKEIGAILDSMWSPFLTYADFKREG